MLLHYPQGRGCNQGVLTDTSLEGSFESVRFLTPGSIQVATQASTSPGETALPGNPGIAHGF